MSLDLSSYQAAINSFLKNYFLQLKQTPNCYSVPLIDAMEYAVMNGGKRFRPTLSLLVGEALGVPTEKTISFAAAVEMIHAFSLIHDDLPCMDDDDIRRGLPTTHKKFGEALALLAGDALQTEAFSLLAQEYSEGAHGIKLVQALARATGLRGMTGGQAMDMGFGEAITNINLLKKVHQGKTGALIAVSVEGVGILARLTAPQQAQLCQFGEWVGLVFQIKDDLLDQHEDSPQKNYPQMIGASATGVELKALSQKAITLLKDLTTRWQSLEKLLVYNLERKH